MNKDLFMNYRYLGFVNDLDEDHQFYWEISIGSYYGFISQNYQLKVHIVLIVVFCGQPILFNILYSLKINLHGDRHSFLLCICRQI